MIFTIAKMNGGKYEISKTNLINFIINKLDSNDRVGWSHVILKGEMTSVFYLDIDKLIELNVNIKDLWPVIKQVLTEYFGNNVDLSYYLLKSVGYYKFHIHFYNIIVSKNTGYRLICEINKRVGKPIIDTLNNYSNTLRFEGCYKYDKDSKSYPKNTDYILIKGSLLNNETFYNNIFKYGEKETPLAKELPLHTVETTNTTNHKNVKIKKQKNTSKKSINAAKVFQQLLVPSTQDKPTVEITCKEDILNCIPNTGEYFQTYEVWWAIAIACKRIGISKQRVEEWTGNTAKDWEKWNVQKPGYAFNFLMKIARTCSNVVNGINATDFVETDLKPHISFNERYCRPFVFTDLISNNVDKKVIKIDTKAIVYQSNLGTGKTTITFDIIKNYRWKSILILTPRRTFATSIHHNVSSNIKNYSFAFYQTKKTTLYDESFVICSMESLHKLKNPYTGEVCDFELVIIDEAESNLSQFSSTTMQKLDNCSQVFENIMRNSKHIIALDGFINPNRSINMLKNFDISYTFIRNEYKHNDLHVNCVGWKKEDIKEFLRQKILKQNKKVYAVITKKTLAIQIYDELRDEFSSNTKKRNVIRSGKIIQEAIPNPKKIKIYHSGLPDTDKVVHNVNAEWSAVDLVITTLTITVGLDYTEDDYDYGICFADAQCGLPRDCVQAMLRMRKLKKWHLIINSGAYTGFAPTMNRYYCNVELKRNIIDKFITSTTKKRSNPPNIGNSQKWLEMPLWLKDVYFTNVYEHDLSKIYYPILLQYFLKVVGFDITNYDYGFEKIPSIVPPFEEVLTINASIYHEQKELLERYNLHYLEWFQHTKYLLLSSGFSGNYEKLWPIWVKKHNNFKNVLAEIKDDIWSVYFDNIEKFQFMERSDLRFKRFQIIKHFSVLFGWRNTLDHTWRILGKDLDSLIDKIVHKDAEYSRIFQVKSAKLKDNKTVTRKTFLEIMNKYLKAWSVNKIVRLKRVRKRQNGVCIVCPDLSEYGFEKTFNLTYEEPAVGCSIVEDD